MSCFGGFSAPVLIIIWGKFERYNNCGINFVAACFSTTSETADSSVSEVTYEKYCS